MRGKFFQTLTLCAAIFLLTAAARARDEPISGECGAEGSHVTWTLYDGEMFIRGEGEIADYPNGDAPWAEQSEDVVFVTIEPGVTGVGKGAFQSCTQIYSAKFPDGLTRIGESAFANIPLHDPAFPDSLTEIGRGAFSGCADMRTVSFSKNLTKISENAFSGCGVFFLFIPEGVTEIEREAFRGCEDMSLVVLPESLKKIGADAFRDCHFREVCYNGTRAQWKEIEISTGNESLTDSSVSRQYGGGRPMVLQSGPCGLMGGDLTWTMYTDQVLTITGQGKMSDRVEEGGMEPWMRYWGDIQTVRVETGTLNVGVFDFSTIFNLRTAILADSVTRIEQGAFAGCHNMTEITIPASVTEIGKNAFDYCGALRDIYYGGAEEQWNAIAAEDGNDALYADSVTVHYNSPIPESNPFTDVRRDQYYYDAVLWAVENGVTNGKTNTSFAPGDTCTRAQTVTFLWRSAGSPRPKSSRNPFTDVHSGDYYYNAVLWAVEHGITNGTSDTTFSPNNRVSRGQVVTFLFRDAGETVKTGAKSFADVRSGSYYYDAVRWAADAGITQGTSSDAFSPSQPCNRGQIVTFLFRRFVE